MNDPKFTGNGWEDYLYWQSQDKKTLKKINSLIKEILRTPYEGLGKPEPLREDKSGYWSRRIDSANRIVYRVLADDSVELTALRTHYQDK
ncbi:MAG: Txe/YoeB family addiction module toxin [Treponemataceae bacterium]|nr:MAG: Txe/YoeB family addiction module toxin [Treponemataceae bacterium]